MPTIPEALALAIQHHQAARLPDAEHIYRQILAVEPNQADALHLLGVLAHQVGNHTFAVEYIGRAIRLEGTQAAFHNNLGEAYRSLGRLPEAIDCYRRTLELAPNFAQAHNSLGIALKTLGKLGEAVACYRTALALKPDYAEALNNLGAAFLAQGKLEDAAACFHRALELKPNYTEAHYNLGNACNDRGKPDDAVACYRRALELKPDFAEAHYNLGLAFAACGKLADAVACYRRTLELKPDFAEAFNNLGSVFLSQGKLAEAAASCCRALELEPDSIKAHITLSLAFTALGKLEEAVAHCRRALKLQPNYAEVHSNLGSILSRQGKLDDCLACFRRALELKPDSASVHSNLILSLNYHLDYSEEAICQEARHWNQRHAEPHANTILPHANERSAKRRLRIGYVSPDFRDHCVAHYVTPLFAAHDHQNHEIICYADVLCPDESTARLRSYSDKWRSIVGLTDEQVAQVIREDRIDILVDLTMHMSAGRLLVFARKPAPVQVCWLAYPGTTGLSTMDYRLTDPFLDPVDHEGHYTETSIRLPDTFWCYDPLTSEPAVNALPALKNGQVTFGCLNNFCKVNASVLKLWAEVLRAVPGSSLLSLASEGFPRDHALAQLQQEGIATERVAFVPNTPRPQYLAQYRRIDIALDTLPYNGHTTSLDGLWMGVPVITLVGKTIVGRAGLCQLSNLGLPELIAKTPEQCVSIAVGLAGDLPRLSRLRSTLRERMQNSPLMNAPRFARNIEAAYRGMWQRWCAKQSITG